MNTTRKAFETWATAAPREWDVTRFGEGSARRPGQYFGYVVQASWEAWQAACAAEREMCAAIADEYEYHMIAGSCACDIRARSRQ